MSGILTAALSYAHFGYHVIPLARNKVPLTGHGFRDASADPAVISAWWGKFPSANVAIACGPKSGLWVLDIDGDEGRESLQLLTERNGELPTTPANITKRGFHVLFKWPNDGRSPRNIVGQIGPGLDVRADGAGFTAPPSVHESGHVYRWAKGRSIFDIPAPDAPVWLIEAACRKPEPKTPPAEYRPCPDDTWGPAPNYSKAALDAAARRIAGASIGTQDHTLNSECYAIGQLVAGGAMPRAFAADVLERAGMMMTNGDPSRPWTVSTIREKVRRAFNDAKAAPRCPERARRIG